MSPQPKIPQPGRPMPEPPARRDREPVTAVVALGSNLGERDETIADAVAAIERLPLVDEVRVSRNFRTVAMRLDGPDPDAPVFVNAVALVTTRLAPSVLLAMLHAIEEEHGRVRAERWGDRTLDLDLITYGDERSAHENLLLPHPRAHERLFVLEPWFDVDPDATLPEHGRIDDLIAGLKAGGA